MIFCAVVFVSWKTIFLHECMRSFTTRDAWRCGIYPLSQVNFWGSYLKSMRLHLFWPEKTDDISRRHQQSLRELTSKKCVISMKFLRKFLRRQLTTPEIPQQTIMLFVCHVKILHKHCLQFLLGVKMARRETENNVYMQNLGWQTKSIMVCNGIFWSGQLAGKPLVALRNVVCFLKLHLFKLLHKKVRGWSNVWKFIHKNLKLWQMWTFANKVAWHVTAKNSKAKMAKVYDYSPLSLSLLD